MGKTTVSRALARRLRADHISIDQILEEKHLWVSGRLDEFLRANLVASRWSERALARGRSVVIDGNFYWKGQLRDLSARLGPGLQVFTLVAPLTLCVERDRERPGGHGRQAAQAVFARSTRFSWGTRVDATRPVAAVVRAIVEALRANARRRAVAGR